MFDDSSWLDIGPPKKQQPKPVDNPRRRELVTALFALTWKQRAYMDALHDHQFDDRAARKVLAEKSCNVSRAEVQRWRTEAAYRRAIQLMQGIAADDAGLSRAAVLAKMAKLADDTRRIVTRRDANDNVIDGPVDGPTARGVLKDMAQALGVLDMQDKNRVTVQIINMSNRDADLAHNVVAEQETKVIEARNL